MVESPPGRKRQRCLGPPAQWAFAQPRVARQPLPLEAAARALPGRQLEVVPGRAGAPGTPAVSNTVEAGDAGSSGTTSEDEAAEGRLRERTLAGRRVRRERRYGALQAEIALAAPCSRS